MRQKAKSSLEACKALVSHRLPDSAASRLYYSLFQAGVHALEHQGMKPGDFTSGATKWTHGWVRDSAYLVRKRHDDRNLFQLAYSLRERADYRSQRVAKHEIEPLLPKVEELVHQVCA